MCPHTDFCLQGYIRATFMMNLGERIMSRKLTVWIEFWKKDLHVFFTFNINDILTGHKY